MTYLFFCYCFQMIFLSYDLKRQFQEILYFLNFVHYFFSNCHPPPRLTYYSKAFMNSASISQRYLCMYVSKVWIFYSQLSLTPWSKKFFIRKIFFLVIVKQCLSIYLIYFTIPLKTIKGRDKNIVWLRGVIEHSAVSLTVSRKKIA